MRKVVLQVCAVDPFDRAVTGSAPLDANLPLDMGSTRSKPASAGEGRSLDFALAKPCSAPPRLRVNPDRPLDGKTPLGMGSIAQNQERGRGDPMWSPFLEVIARIEGAHAGAPLQADRTDHSPLDMGFIVTFREPRGTTAPQPPPPPPPAPFWLLSSGFCLPAPPASAPGPGGSAAAGGSRRPPPPAHGPGSGSPGSPAPS